MRIKRILFVQGILNVVLVHFLAFGLLFAFAHVPDPLPLRLKLWFAMVIVMPIATLVIALLCIIVSSRLPDIKHPLFWVLLGFLPGFWLLFVLLWDILRP